MTTRPDVTDTDPAVGPDLCRAPYASLYLDTRGVARPCCQSTLELGRITDQSLPEIWAGEPAQRLREALDRGDLSLGCEFCAGPHERGDDAAMYARRYDEVPVRVAGSRVDTPARLEVAPSSTCNLRCTMCNGEWSSSIRIRREGLPAMPRSFDDRFFADVEHWLDDLEEVELFGGEPFLGREPLRLLELLADRADHVRVQVTTNATIWNDRVERLARALKMRVAVSVDGSTRETYESIRLGSIWDRLQENLERFRAVLAGPDQGVDLAFCLMVDNWTEAADMCRWAAATGAHLWVNTVEHPPLRSLHHLLPQELAVVIEGMETDSPEIERLGEPVASVWRAELRRLRTTLDHRWERDSTADPADDPGVAAMDALGLTIERPDRVLSMRTDDRLRITDVTVTAAGGRDDHLPEVVGSDLVGRMASVAVTAPPGTPCVVHDACAWWTADQALVERVHLSAPGPVHERRELTFVDGRATVRVEERVMPTEAELEAALRRAGPVAVVDFDHGGAVTSLPEPDDAELLGVCAEQGRTYPDPRDMLVHGAPSPGLVVTMHRVDPITSVGSFTWSDGRALVLLVRQRFEGDRGAGSRGFFVRRPATGTAG